MAVRENDVALRYLVRMQGTEGSNQECNSSISVNDEEMWRMRQLSSRYKKAVQGRDWAVEGTSSSHTVMIHEDRML